MFKPTSLHRWMPVLICALLIGCGASTTTTPTAVPPAQPTAAPPTTAPTAIPPTDIPPTEAPAEPTAAPAEPTEAPAEPTEAPAEPAEAASAGGMLPAPLYFIDAENQISRIEKDGTTITQITNETDKVFEFVVSPADGSLAYITIADDGFTNRLIHTDAMGQGRTELQTGVMRGLAISYTGESVEVGIGDPAPNMQMMPEARTPGVWSFPLGREAPTLIQASTPPTKGADGSEVPGDHYMPLAWSPDGQKLLLRTTINYGPDAPAGDIGTIGLALFEKQAGTVTQLLATMSEPLCLLPSWDGHSVLIYCSTPFFLSDNTPALWRLNIVTGEKETLIPIKDGDKTNTVFNAREKDDGLYSLVATVDGNSSETPSYIAQRTGQDAVSGRKQLVADPLTLGYGAMLWSDDASGMVVPIAKGDSEVDLTWYPFLGGEPFVLVSGQVGSVLAWGK